MTYRAAQVHLAGTPDDADFASDLLPNNILGMQNLMHACVAAGVKRIVFASSMQVNWFQLLKPAAAGTSPPLISPSDPPTPRHWCPPHLKADAALRARLGDYTIIATNRHQHSQHVRVGQAVLRSHRLRLRTLAWHRFHRRASGLVPPPWPAGRCQTAALKRSVKPKPKPRVA
jgi:hypothetical protein